jgi:SAM-dependent methyltransferase
MHETPDIKAVKDHWDAQARDSGISPAAVTHRDHQQRLLEIAIVSRHLQPGSRLLDVGCGNGYATALLAPRVASVLAVDYSAAMIERARREHASVPNIQWKVDDVLVLAVPEAGFDAALTLRCLINLGSWEMQQRAILNILRTLRPGGLFLMAEGSQQGRAALNQARVRCGLSAMPRVPYNLDLDETMLWPFLKQHFEVVEVSRLGIYDLISRVVHPLLVQPEEPRYDARINEVGRQINEQLGGLDSIAREFIAVLRKR